MVGGEGPDLPIPSGQTAAAQSWRAAPTKPRLLQPQSGLSHSLQRWVSRAVRAAKGEVRELLAETIHRVVAVELAMGRHVDADLLLPARGLGG
mgnify:FL=1